MCPKVSGTPWLNDGARAGVNSPQGSGSELSRGEQPCAEGGQGMRPQTWQRCLGVGWGG